MEGYSKDEWIGWRKTWRSLVFLERLQALFPSPFHHECWEAHSLNIRPSWLAGTLGLLPSVDPMMAHNCIQEKVR